MRLTAYKKMMDSAHSLPDELDGADYFKKAPFNHNPRLNAISKVLETARLDIKGLFIEELIELHDYSNNITQIGESNDNP